MTNISYWIISSKGNNYEKLNNHISTNCVIVGGGIVGATSAYLLAKQGVEVVLVDADKVGYGSSGRNTGKACTQHGIVYSKIYKKYGLDTASMYYEINNKGLDLIERIIKENNIECNFERIPSFILTQDESYIIKLKNEYEICKKIGIDCEYHNSLDVPLEVKGAVSFNNQAQFNPKKYIDGLIRSCVKLGVKVYENTAIVDIEKGDTCKLKTEENKIIEANNVIIASHVPWYDGLNLYFAKQKGDRSYLLGAPIKNKFQRGMFISAEEPTKTFRVYEGDGERLLIFGGNDHKVGQGKKEGEIYEELSNCAKETFGVEEIKYKWSAQDYMSFDNIPYIGYINKKSNNIYVATGFCKWGMTNGCGAGIIISDLIINKKSKYQDIFNTSRKGSFFTKEFIKENVDVGIKYVGGKLKIGSNDMPMERGEGRIVNIDGKRYGAYRHFNDKLYVLDITCTHLGCELVFNGAEKTWDCPCHASRFDYEGNIVEGPALKPLNRYNEVKNDIDPKLI